MGNVQHVVRLIRPMLSSLKLHSHFKICFVKLPEDLQGLQSLVLEEKTSLAKTRNL